MFTASTNKISSNNISTLSLIEISEEVSIIINSVLVFQKIRDSGKFFYFPERAFVITSL